MQTWGFLVGIVQRFIVYSQPAANWFHTANVWAMKSISINIGRGCRFQVNWVASFIRDTRIGLTISGCNLVLVSDYRKGRPGFEARGDCFPCPVALFEKVTGLTGMDNELEKQYD